MYISVTECSVTNFFSSNDSLKILWLEIGILYITLESCAALLCFHFRWAESALVSEHKTTG